MWWKRTPERRRFARECASLSLTRRRTGEAIVALVEVGNCNEKARDDVTQVIFRIGEAHSTIQRAIDACAGEKQERSEG